jgi:hypothetical protein
MRRFFSGVLLTATLASPVAADTAMFDFPAPATASSTERGTDGFRFTPNVNIEVTALGYYDHNQDGFTSGFHPVAIYDFVTKVQLAKVSVQSTSPLDGLFRYAEIEPLALAGGTSYVLAGYTSPQNNSNAENPAGLTTASEITFQGYRFAVGGSDVSFPNETFGDPFFGPNLLFRTESVTQPGDTNDDGLVDLVDLNNVRNNFGASGQPVLGDTAPFDGRPASRSPPGGRLDFFYSLRRKQKGPRDGSHGPWLC